ncbi:U-box domain-containing protein 45-like [Rutidosis leptorrhynchoides]|uniref:U-box domain-containing protein 45-like n=1 Tax=Rutidosis leptorrhynchoides TaxID=125765 RepID=UPI003A9A6090
MVEESSSSSRAAEQAFNHKKQTLIDEISGKVITGDLPTKIQAAREIRSLIRHRNSSDKIRTKFAAAGVIKPLVLMLYSKVHDAREVSLLALLNLASRNERNKEQIVTCGAIPPLVELLKFQNASTMRKLATAAILTLSTAPPNKHTLVESGVIPLLVQILSCGNVQGRVDAVTALYNLTTSNEQPTIIPDPNAIPPLINLLKECKKSSNFAEKTIILIGIILKSEEGRLSITKANNGILTLVETIEDGSLVSTEHAVSALLSLCQSCRSKYRQLILNEGPIPGLLRLTVYGTVQAQDMARTLLDLLRDSPTEKRLSSSVLETIVHDIAARVDGSETTAETAKSLLQDMVQRSMSIT